MPITTDRTARAANATRLANSRGPVCLGQRQRRCALLDLSRIASETGFRSPVAISQGALCQCLAGLPELGPGRYPSHDAARRLWGVLWAAAAAAHHQHCDAPIPFDAPLEPLPQALPAGARITLKLVIRYGEHGQPLAAILLPDETWQD